MVSLGNGIAADGAINCHVAKDADEKVISLIGRKFINIKMKISEYVRSFATINPTMKIKDKVVAIEPMVLYQRILFVKKDSNDLAGYFKYGLAPYPLALFINTGMKKTV